MINLSFRLFSVLLIFTASLFAAPVIADSIEEIIVKANYRETLLVENDGSLLLLEEKQLQDQPMKHFEELTFLVPNLNMAVSDGRPRYFQIRGIGERSGYEGTPNSSVGFIIDDIDFSGQGGVASSFDMEQVEVHRGPQGSRMGANALAGMIYMRSKEPSDSFEGLSELTLGSDGIRNIGLAFGGPFEGNTAIKYRVSLRQDETDGFRKNLYLNRDDTTGKEELTGRLKLNWQLSEITDLSFLLLNSDFDASSDTWNIDGSLNTLSDKPGLDSQDTRAYGLKINHQATNAIVQSLTSATNSDVTVSYDADWGNPVSNSPYTYDFFSETQRSRRSFNQEFRVLSEPLDKTLDDDFAWVIGAYYLKLNERNDIRDLGTYIDPFSPWPPYFKDVSATRDYASENKAIFGSFDYSLSPSMRLSFGLRWEDWEADYSDTFGESFSPSDQMFGGKVSLINQWDQSTNIYASIGRGFKSGGFNLGTGLSIESFNDTLVYEPEYLWNYEIGVNHQFSESNTGIDMIIFYSDRKDQQVMASTQVDPGDPNTFTFLTQNAASGKNYGLEMTVKSNPSDQLSMYASVGLLRTKVTEHGSNITLEGRDQAHAPRTSYAAGMKWFVTDDIYISMGINGKSSFYYSDSHNNKSSAYTIGNIVLGYQRDQWKYEFWARNIFDEYFSLRGFYFGNVPPDFPATLFERQGDPRHMGLIVRYEF